MKKHILVISQYFHPEVFRINDICKEWVKRGYKVTVVTGIPNYPQGRFYNGYSCFKKRREKYEGVDIIRLPIIRRGNSAVMLMLNYVSFVVSGFLWKVFTKVKADRVFIYEVSPMTQALVGVWYAKKLRIPCDLYVTDLWPENVEIAGNVHNKFVLKCIGKMVDYIYKNCQNIFTSSKSFIPKISERNVDRSKLVFWPQYAEDFYCQTSKKSDDIPEGDNLNFLFAGNVGYAQNLGILVEAAKRLKSRDEKVIFHIVGDGRFKGRLQEMVENEDVGEYFNFIDRKPAEKIPTYMAAADIAVICLAKSEVFAMTIPAKTQSCMACGKPILVSADGEIQEIISDAACGLSSDADDAEGLLSNIEKFMQMSDDERKRLGDNSLEYYNQHFNKKKLMDKIEKYI